MDGRAREKEPEVVFPPEISWGSECDHRNGTSVFSARHMSRRLVLGTWSGPRD